MLYISSEWGAIDLIQTELDSNPDRSNINTLRQQFYESILFATHIQKRIDNVNWMETKLSIEADAHEKESIHNDITALCIDLGKLVREVLDMKELD